jgi:hypothetical protein
MLVQVVHIFEHVALHRPRDGNVIDQTSGAIASTPQRHSEPRTRGEAAILSPQMNHIFTEPYATGMRTDRHSKPEQHRKKKGLAKKKIGGDLLTLWP